MSDPRDTQFAGFAKLLMQEMIALRGYIDIGGYTDEDALSSASDYAEIIARRAFDLVGHALDHAFTHAIVFESPEDCASQIPDLTQWPEVNT